MRIITVLLVLAAATSLSAQDRVLTFEEAVKIGLENNVLLNQQKNQLEFNQVQKSAAMANFAPNVNLNGQAVQFSGNSFNNNTGQVVNGIRDNVSGSLNANMVLFNGTGRLSTLKAAANQLDAQSYFVKRTSEDVVNTVAAQYLNVLLDIELLRIAKENFEVQRKQLEQITEQVTLGARAPVDQLNQEAQTNSAELRMLQAEINLNNDKAILTTTLLLDPVQNIEVVKPAWGIEELLNDSRDFESLYEIAKANRGDLNRAISQEKAAQYNMNSARANYMPTISAFFNYGSSYNFQHDVPDSVQQASTEYVLNGTQIDPVTTFETVSNPFLPRSFKDQFSSDNVFKSYGLTMTIPIFNGFQARTQHYQQRVAYRNSKLNRSNVELQAKTDVLRTHRNFQVQKKTFVVSQSQVRAASQAFVLEQERFNLGVTNFVEYVRANQVLVQAQTDMAQAEFRLLFQKVLLEYAVGTLNVDVDKK